MAENLQKYGIEIGFEDALKKLNKLRVTQKKMNQIQENSLSTQIQLQKRLNALKKAGVKFSGMGGASPSMPTKPMMDSHVALMQKEMRKRMLEGQPPKEPSRPRTTPLAKQMKQDFAAQAKKNTQFLKEQTKETQRQLSLEREKENIRKTNRLFLQKELTTEEKLSKRKIEGFLASSKNTKELKDQVRWQMASLNATKKRTTQLRKQSFLMQRMQASSQQFAGNMVSAFAVAAGVTGVVRIGQDFEAVNNTMLAVSENAEVAGENFQFVRDEAFRLGLGLKESASGFAKMKAAQGEMADQDMESLFIGVAEASTVLGLSVEEQSRSINAISQMLSKGKISAEELRLQLGKHSFELCSV